MSAQDTSHDGPLTDVLIVVFSILLLTVTAAPIDTNIMLWQAVIFGPDDTPWEGGIGIWPRTVKACRVLITFDVGLLASREGFLDGAVLSHGNSYLVRQYLYCSGVLHDLRVGLQWKQNKLEQIILQKPKLATFVKDSS